MGSDPNLPANSMPVYFGGGVPANVAVNENVQVKAAPGVFYGVGVNTGGTTSTAALYDGLSGVATLPVASPGVISCPALKDLQPGAAIKLTNAGGALPTGLTANTTVYVSSAGFAAGVFHVADTKAHAIAGTNSINFTGSESGVQTAWDVSTPIGTFDTTAAGQVPYPFIGAQFAKGLIAITAGAAAADITFLYR